MEVVFATILSVVLVSCVSFIGALSLAINQEKLHHLLLTLVSISAGTLFGGAFLHLLPEAAEGNGLTVSISLLALSGVVVFFILERFIHYRHQCDSQKASYQQHHHYQQHHNAQQHHHHKVTKPFHIGLINLAGDALHNFLDGLVIAGSYLVSIPVGIAMTVAVILHEVPQELADFGVLLYAGFSKKKALFLNFLSAAVAIVGAIVGLILGTNSEAFVLMILPFTAGGFLYIAGANLIPELHKECGLRNSIWHVLALIFGIGLMWALTFLE